MAKSFSQYKQISRRTAVKRVALTVMYNDDVDLSPLKNNNMYRFSLLPHHRFFMGEKRKISIIIIFHLPIR